MNAPQSVFSIVIPIHNEADFLPRALPSLQEELADLGVPFDINLVENGSTDGTAESAKKESTNFPEVRVTQQPIPDYGAAMFAGFMEATGTWVINFDIDYTSGSFLNRVLAEGADADVILASKRAPGSDDRRGVVRRLATFAFNTVLRVLVKSSVSDTHGIKAIRRDVVQDLAPRVKSRTDLFDTELIVRAGHAGYRIAEFPIVVEEQREARSKLWKRIPRTIRGIWRIRRQLKSEGVL
jgi:glycosyltransferase involved in cell wall biosynthesis